MRDFKTMFSDAAIGCSVKISALKIFVNFTGKNVSWCLFNTFAGLRLLISQIILKKLVLISRP